MNGRTHLSSELTGATSLQSYYDSILNDCIYRAWWPGNCDDTLKKLEEQINNGGLQDKIEYAMYKVADAGRQAGGANPRESFQTFVLEYITFFDDAMSPECNDYTWAYWPPFISNQPKLTKELREKLNDFTRKVNKVIKDAAKNLEQMGVIYVEGLQDKYKGHRYCEPGANLEQTEAKVWFWTHGAHFNTPSEGPGDPNGAQTAVVDPAKQLLYFVFPGDNKVVPTSENEQPPWKWEGADKYPDFESLLKGIRENGDVDAEGAPFNLLRTFHPKATAYKEHVKLLFGAIADNREVTKTGTSPSEGDGEVPCVPSGGPMATGYVCQCTTTVSGELYVTKTDMIDGACTSYTTYPGPVTKAPPAPTQGPVKGLYTTTTDGTVLAYESYSESSWVLGFIGKTITNTYGVGAAKTLSVPPPTQTGVDNRGSGQCSTKDGLSRTGLREACDRAISKFEDDTIYDKFTSRYSRLKKGILMTASVWQAACYVNFACDDYGIGMSGKLIKEAYVPLATFHSTTRNKSLELTSGGVSRREYAKANDGIGACGHIKLSNSCELKFDYCTKCKTWN